MPLQRTRKSWFKNSPSIVRGAWAKEGQKPFRVLGSASPAVLGHEGSGRGNICCVGFSHRPRKVGKVSERVSSPCKVIPVWLQECYSNPVCPPTPPAPPPLSPRAHLCPFCPLLSPVPARFCGWQLGQERGDTNPLCTPGKISVVNPKLLKLSSKFYFLWGRSCLK